MRRLVVLVVALVTTGVGASAGGGAAGAASTPPSADPAAVAGELLVGYRSGATAPQRANARARASAELQDRVVRGEGHRGEVELVRLPRGADRSAAARRLQEDPAVSYAEPNWLLTHSGVATDPYYTDGSLWGMYGDATAPPATNVYGSQAGEAWAAGNTGSPLVYVGVIDEGIQYTHPDLEGQVWTNPFDTADGIDNDGNGYIDDIRGWDFANGDNTIYDGGKRGTLDDHGTHVAGTIGAKANTEGVVGVSWNVTLISGKFLGRRGGTLANAVKAVDYFTDLKRRHGLNIVATNNSWGGGGFSRALLDAINRGGDEGILFIAAAGNGGGDGVGDDNDTTATYPSNYQCTANGSYDCVIAVAAITSGGEKASFSNFGAKTVDLGAPGLGVWSTTAPNQYEAYGGTSMATPHVTGGAVLYKAANPLATGAEVRVAILAGAAPTASLAGRTVTGGRLDVSGF